MASVITIKAERDVDRQNQLGTPCIQVALGRKMFNGRTLAVLRRSRAK